MNRTIDEEKERPVFGPVYAWDGDPIVLILGSTQGDRDYILTFNLESKEIERTWIWDGPWVSTHWEEISDD